LRVTDFDIKSQILNQNKEVAHALIIQAQLLNLIDGLLKLAEE
jgi:hypothetical protein